MAGIQETRQAPWGKKGVQGKALAISIYIMGINVEITKLGYNPYNYGYTQNIMGITLVRIPTTVVN